MVLVFNRSFISLKKQNKANLLQNTHTQGIGVVYIYEAVALLETCVAKCTNLKSLIYFQEQTFLPLHNWEANLETWFG